MTDRSMNDEQKVLEAIREAFPLDAGLSAEDTWRMHAKLQPVAAATRRPRRRLLLAGVGIAACLVAGVGLTAAYLVRGTPPQGNVADRFEAAYPDGRVVAGPQQSSAVPAMALKAISPTDKVLHFTSEADTTFGPEAGASTEEMWFDPETGAGRLVRVNGTGNSALTTTLISDGTTASVTIERPGSPKVTEPADMAGRLGKSFDKLATYRKMLESGTATVTARGMVDGVETYRLRAEVDGFGAPEMRMVMEAEIRSDDYLPISFRSGFVDPNGAVLKLRTRTFSKFEAVDVSELPSDWFTPLTKTTGAVSGVVDL